MYNTYKKIKSKKTGYIFNTGWLPSLPDLRDYTENHVEINPIIKKLNFSKTGESNFLLPENVDLRTWCSEVEDQGGIGSCTAQSAVGIIEYYENKAFGKHIDGSRLFVYKTTRNLMGVKGDTGAWLRNVMGALALCGVPSEKYWPYSDKKDEFDKEPPAFVYSIADNYEAIKYFCHDPLSEKKTTEKILESVKKYLTVGIPSMFGFYGFPSFENTDVKGGIPYPGPDESAEWGHAVVAVGYDDKIKIKNTITNKQTTGALLIRNSWGINWGDNGYGWLPYDYVLNNLAQEFWSLLNMKWVDTKQFGY